MKGKKYTSPKHKLVKFFLRSRDNWRSRAEEYRSENRRLMVRIRDLECSRDHWRGKYFESRGDSRAEGGTESDSAAEPSVGGAEGGALALAATGALPGAPTRYRVQQPDGRWMEWEVLGSPAATAPGHHYDLPTMRLTLDWVCEANSSLRGASRSFGALPGVEAPSCWAIRLWVLRVGLYELSRPKERAQDWAFMVDATIGLGEDKAVVVLGARLGQMQEQGFNLGHQDVSPLAIAIVSRCNGEAVQAALARAAQTVGVPLMVASDGGSEVKKGVGLFQAEHPQVAWHYDVSHRFALLLEKELGGQEWWAPFITQTSQCRQQCQQTAWSHLLPPALRVKARWLNVRPVVAWALKVLDFARCGDTNGAFARLFGWLKGYQQPLQEALGMLTLLEEFSRLIKHQGLNRRHVCQCEQLMDRLGVKGLVRRVGNLALAFLYTEAAAVPRGQTHLASSDVLESLFGKYKAVVERSPLHAITEVVLELAAFTSPRTEPVIRQAMESVSTADVTAWSEANCQPTLLAKRRQAFA
jgi:hypothetical protein